MHSKNDNNTLTIYLEGELNSSNASDVENQINEIIRNSKYQNLILDLEELNYISSAGLRVILKLRKDNPNFKIINASLEVYDVFSMTGFTNMMDISRALVKIDITGAKLIGEGYCGNVYRINKDTIIKVFKFTTDIKDIERELNLAKEAFVLGIPTAIGFDVVKVGDKLGVRFEMLDCASLRDKIRDNPKQFDELMKQYTTLLKKINTTSSMGDLPDAKKLWLNKVELLKEYLEPNEYEHLKMLVESIEDRDTFVHGDCHIKNIMCQENEMLIIDMDTLSYGNPIFELASLYAPYLAFEEDDPGNAERFLGIPYKTSKKIYDTLLHNYLDKDNEDIREQIALLAYMHMMWWTKTYQKENQLRFDNCKKRMLKRLFKFNKLGF